MFEVPGSSVKYVAVTGKVARREGAPVYFGRGQAGRFRELIDGDDAEVGAEGGTRVSGDGEMGSFEEYREKSRAAGVMGSGTYVLRDDLRIGWG
ncbi:MAG: hypothetical protein L6R39_007634 [Caloplaca ligustica]|nr:MAG: hypothetical protein L6R39_007634 [Caloplaca ligustica]